MPRSTHDKVNYFLFITGDVGFNLFRYTEVSSLFTEAHLLFLTITSILLILICPADLSSNFKCIVLTLLSFISICFPFAHWLIDLQKLCSSLISEILEFLGTSPFAGIVINCVGMCFN